MVFYEQARSYVASGRRLDRARALIERFLTMPPQPDQASHADGRRLLARIERMLGAERR
jgi:hypothetical protein